MADVESTPRPLTATQERKLLDFLDEKFLELNRNYKKRSDPSSSLPTLSAYLKEVHHLLSLILQIPPVDPSGSLRTTLLLRLTGEVMASVPGYLPDLDTLPELLQWLNDLDNGWLAVLRAQFWDTEAREGVDVVTRTSTDSSQPLQCSLITQTERARLRSLLVSGTGAMEEWLVRLNVAGEDYTVALARLGLQQGFDELFSGTLAEMGSLAGTMNAPEGMEGTC